MTHTILDRSSFHQSLFNVVRIESRPNSRFESVSKQTSFGEGLLACLVLHSFLSRRAPPIRPIHKPPKPSPLDRMRPLHFGTITVTLQRRSSPSHRHPSVSYSAIPLSTIISSRTSSSKMRRNTGNRRSTRNLTDTLLLVTNASFQSCSTNHNPQPRTDISHLYL